MKLAWRYAMLPSASAKIVLFDELECRSSTARNSLRLRALVRVYDCVSARTGTFIRLTVIHLPLSERTTGPCCVRYTTNCRCDSARRAIRDRDPVAHDRPRLAAVAIRVALPALGDGLGELVDVVHAAGCVHPSRAVIEALVDEELSPGHCAVCIESFVADHLQLRPEEEGRVRIDEQQRVVVHRV